MTAQTSAFSKPIRVVVADDSAFTRRLIADALTERGAQVVGVGRDGDDALKLRAQHRPDVVSLDLTCKVAGSVEQPIAARDAARLRAAA